MGSGSSPPVANPLEVSSPDPNQAVMVVGVEPATVPGSKRVSSVQLAVEGDLRGALHAGLLHEPRNLGLALEEALERALVGPLINHEDLVVAAGECVSDCSRCLTGFRDPSHHLRIAGRVLLE